MALLGPSLLPRPDMPPVSPLSRYRSTPTAIDTKPSHKNLYVLNLPLDASTDQLTALFSSYGTVVHCVILAMLDAQARRRGFIDMSSPNEAKEAIEGLNGFVWHGYPIEVSYAIVQRSGGPFDQVTGRNIIKRNVPRNRFNTGPRRVPSDSALGAAFFGESGNNALTGAGGFGMATYGSDMGSPGYSEASSRAPSEREDDASSATDPYTIFIAGLDPVAIIDDDDFRHALQPYGTITAATLCRDERGTSRGFGIVTFANQEEATIACENLNGKVINGRRLSAHKYVYQTHPSIVRANMPIAASGMALGGNLPITPRPPTLQRRGLMGGSNSLIPNMPFSPSSLVQQMPLLNINARMAPRSPLSTTAWPSSGQGQSHLYATQRMEQMPMGSIGSALNDTWLPPSTSLRGNASANTASFFKANGASRPIEIKPDLKQVDSKPIDKEQNPSVLDKQLGDAFMPMPKSLNDRISDDSKADIIKESGDAKGNSVLMTPSGAFGSQPSTMTLMRTPAPATNSLWNTVSGTGSLALDGMSPESTMSMASTASSLSQLNTPEAARGSDSTTIWSHSASHDRMNASIRSAVSPGSWLSNSPPNVNDKRINVTGSAILSLQNSDVVEKTASRTASVMAPVGHEKTSSSPLRTLRPFKEEGEIEAREV